MGILDDDVARVREATDLVALAGEHIALKRVGRRFMGLCPFHTEKTPSFSVNPELGVYYCFGCQKSGDSITFIREIEHLDFVEAVERLAARAGITLRYDNVAVGKDRKRKERLSEVVGAAIAFYHHLLVAAPEGGPGRKHLRARNFDAEIVIMDVTDSRRVTEVADELAARHGRIDVLVNNAGIARSETPAEQVTDEHWLNVIDVNLNGTFWCCRAFGKHMLGAKSGSIVNIGSMSGFIVNKPQEQCYYNASKAAVHHLTKSLAAEWGARGVRVNAVAPTYIETPLNAFVKSSPKMYDAWIGGTPMARLGQVEEIASVVLFLASDAASLMTGSIVVVDGGYTCW